MVMVIYFFAKMKLVVMDGRMEMSMVMDNMVVFLELDLMVVEMGW
jgi:hypothetical protein